MKKRVLSILLVVAMLASLCSVSAFAADTFGVQVELQNNQAKTGLEVVLTTTSAPGKTYDVYFIDSSNSDLADAGITSAAGLMDGQTDKSVFATSVASYNPVIVSVPFATGETTAKANVTGLTANKTYWFVAWGPDEDLGAANDATLNASGLISVPQCEITWDLNYTGAAAATKGEQDQGGTVTLPTAPTRAGYIFNGWFDAADAGNEITGASTVPSATTVTYYAQWTEKAEPTVPTTDAVTYKNGLKLSDVTLNGGTGTWAWTTGTTPLTVTAGTTYEAKVAETTTHKAATANVNVVVNKGAVTVTGAAQGRIGKTLDSIDLTGKVTVKDANNNAYTLTPESIEWKTPTDVIATNKNDHTVVVTLKAADAALYDLDPNGEYDVEVEGVDKEPTTFSGVKDLTGKVDETLTPTVTASSGKTVTYTSSDETKVKVENGKLVLVAVGEATITASVEGDADWAANTTTFKVTVVEAADPHAAFMFGYANTKNFGPDDSLNRAQAVTILARLDGWTDGEETPLTGAMFSDVKEKDAAGNDIWYYDAVCYAKENGIVEGFADGTFGADKPITRAEFTKMLSRLSNGGVDPADADSTLADAKAHWANKWIADVETTYPGSITGRQDGKFHPDDKITRAETAKIINACLGRLQLVSPKEEDQMDADLNAFDDVIRCTWYYNNVIEATVDHDASDADFHTVD